MEGLNASKRTRFFTKTKQGERVLSRKHVRPAVSTEIYTVIQPLVGLLSVVQSVSKSACGHNHPSSSSQSVSQPALRLLQRQQREWKKSNRFEEQNNNFARA